MDAANTPHPAAPVPPAGGDAPIMWPPEHVQMFSRATYDDRMFRWLLAASQVSGDDPEQKLCAGALDCLKQYRKLKAEMEAAERELYDHMAAISEMRRNHER